jgi:SAM-dependent methyltransferase
MFSMLDHLDIELSQANILDVGCGNGGLLAAIVNAGADPCRLVGVDVLEDRIREAEERQLKGIQWHLGELDGLEKERMFDLVIACTVFSSIFSEPDRVALASSMWDRVRPGGGVLLYDFRMGNPLNPDVRRVKISAAVSWWPSSVRLVRTLHLPPPLARFLRGPLGQLDPFLERIFPPIRSHFMMLCRKPVAEPWQSPC